MAEIAVSFAVEKMGDLLFKEAMFCGGVPVQVDLLKDELRRMQSFLKDVDARQHEAEGVQLGFRDPVSRLSGRGRHLPLPLQCAHAWKDQAVPLARLQKAMVSRWKTGKQIEGISSRLVNYGINNCIGEATTTAGQMLPKLTYISPIVEVMRIDSFFSSHISCKWG